MVLSETWGFSKIQSIQDLDKFDKAPAKKRVDPTVINQENNCRD